MTMSAATATFVILATVIASAATAVSAAAATFVAQLVQNALDLLFRGVAVREHLARKLQRLAGQRVVGVQRHRFVVHCDDTSQEALALIVVQHDDGVHVDMLAVKPAVYIELLALHFVHALLIVVTEGLSGCQGEIELLALLQLYHTLLKSVEREAEACDEIEGLSLFGLFHQLFLAVVFDGIQCVTY